MALEIERRFLVIRDDWRLKAVIQQKYRQAYLTSSVEGVTLRVRIRDDGKSWLTLKAPTNYSNFVRHEFEYEIPAADASDMWDISSKRLIKSRYFLDIEGVDWIVDCFEGSNYPLEIAEVELPTEDTFCAIPDWCGLEITGQDRWSNAALANCPFKNWSINERRKYLINEID